MGGGAWLFLVGGVICLVNSVNERDLDLLTSVTMLLLCDRLLRGTLCAQHEEVWGNNRSVMPLDVLGCTRATLMYSPSWHAAWKCGVIFESASWWGLTIATIRLQRGISSRCEASACTDYVPAICTHRPSLLPIEWSGEIFGPELSGVRSQ